MAYSENKFEILDRTSLAAVVRSQGDEWSWFCWQQECYFYDWRQNRVQLPAQYAGVLTDDDWLRGAEPLDLLTTSPLEKPRYLKTADDLAVRLRYHPGLAPNLTLAGMTVSCQNPQPESYLAAAYLKARFPWLTINLPPAPEGERDPFLVSFGVKRHYFRRILLGRRPSAGLRLLDGFGLLEVYLPELTAGRNLSQNRFHAYDIFEHLLRACDGATEAIEEVRWAALLHDIGKVGTRRETENGEASFHNHEILSAKQTVTIMKRLGMPRDIGQKIKFLVRNHMFHYTDEWSDKAVRRFMRKVTREDLKLLIALRLADRKGSGKKTAFPKALQKLIDHITELEQEERRFKVRDLAINGHDLIQLGMEPGPEMGKLLRQFTQAVADGHLSNDPEILLARAKEQIAARAS